MRIPDFDELTGLAKYPKEFFNEKSANLPDELMAEKQIGVYRFKDFFAKAGTDVPEFSYDKRVYYKISLIRGSSCIGYADKVIDIDGNALVFGTPDIPYVYSTKHMSDEGYFCLYTAHFLSPAYSGVILNSLPLFQPGNIPVFRLTDVEFTAFNELFEKMHLEMQSDYDFKYDLIRTFIIELIHFAQKLSPFKFRHDLHNAGSRVTALFIDLLERQFPIVPTKDVLMLRTAKQFAARLGIHTTNLNHYLKSNSGKTTTEHINLRVITEAKHLLQNTNFSISEITYALGFEQLSHFSAFFKKYTKMSPSSFRGLMLRRPGT